MNACVLILLCLIGSVYQLEITSSYTTSSRCADGSYALIRGDNLTLHFDYGFNKSELKSLQLYEQISGHRMFDYENGSGKPHIKDKTITPYWTNTGIIITITNIQKKDLRKYEVTVVKGTERNSTVIEINKIWDHRNATVCPLGEPRTLKAEENGTNVPSGSEKMWKRYTFGLFVYYTFYIILFS